MQKIQISFPNSLMGRVRAVAAEEDRPVSEIIRRAVERFFRNEAKQPITKSSAACFLWR